MKRRQAGRENRTCSGHQGDSSASSPTHGRIGAAAVDVTALPRQWVSLRNPLDPCGLATGRHTGRCFDGDDPLPRGGRTNDYVSGCFGPERLPEGRRIPTKEWNGVRPHYDKNGRDRTRKSDRMRTPMRCSRRSTSGRPVNGSVPNHRLAEQRPTAERRQGQLRVVAPSTRKYNALLREKNSGSDLTTPALSGTDFEIRISDFRARDARRNR